MRRNEIIKYINDYLNSDKIADSSQNGLQVEGAEEVKKIVFGVSAGAELFNRAAKSGADMVITHHGLLWGKNPRVTGVFKKRIEILIKNNISLAAWHLPLDLHKTAGNNAQIAHALGLKNIKPFGEYHGVKIGFAGVLQNGKTTKEIEKMLGLKANTVLPFGPVKNKKIAIISGGGYSIFEQAADAGYDLFISGSAEEFVQEIAKECKINYMAAGHYNSEKYGVLALMELISKKFKVETKFIDVGNSI